MPSFREFRYELFEHGNILWSSLRGMGQPMLANGVQSAPLFPLNLALIGLPDQLYWSVMPLLRILLIALGCYVICRHCFGLSITASLVFAIMTGLNLNVLRWINHPWSNGILAGVWYLYFNCRLLSAMQLRRRTLALLCCGLVISVAGMLTAGFPEASAVSAILITPLFLAVLINNWSTYKPQFRRAFTLIIACHIIGFLLCSIQLFALFEYISYSGTFELRKGYIGRSFTPEQVQPYWLSQFSIFWLSPTQRTYINFNTGMLGLCLTLIGIVALLTTLRRKQNFIISIAFVCLMWLFVAKSFGWSSGLEWIFANTPVLAQSHFPLYFSPLFYFGVAFFAALGAEFLVDRYGQRVQRKWWLALFWLGLAALIVKLVTVSTWVMNGVPAIDVWQVHKRGDGFNNLIIFIAVVSILIALALIPVRQTLQRVSGVVLILALVIEMGATLQKNYADIDSETLFRSPATTELISKAVAQAPLPLHELRSNDQIGYYAGLGLATIDNGISAMLPADQRLVRRILFHTQYGGYLPLEAPRQEWSYDVLSSNILVVHETPSLTHDWRSHEPQPEINPTLLEWDRAIQVMRDNPLILQGIASGHFTQNGHPEIWVRLQNGEQVAWIKAQTSRHKTLGISNGRHHLQSDWQIHLPTYWITAQSYQFSLRLVDSDNNEYADTATENLTLRRQYHFDEPTLPAAKFAMAPGLQLLASSADNNHHVYYRPSALPRAYTADSCQVMHDEQQILAFLRESDAAAKGVVALQNTDMGEPVDCASLQSDFHRVPITADRGSSLSLENITGPALLILNDQHYPGWQAYDSLSGDRLPIHSANLTSRAVFLPEPREYQINFAYRPWWLVWVKVFLLAGLLCMLGLMLIIFKRFAVPSQ